MRKFFIKWVLTLCLLMTSTAFAQTREITFPFYDGSADYFTMKQSDDLYLSLYQLGTDMLFESNIEPVVLGDTVLERLGAIGKMIPQVTLWMTDSLLFIPITHEEAHRAILTDKGIGSISQPFFNENGVAYVKGVTDATLENLRDTDFPTFIRMHTAGNESDYCIAQKAFQRFTFLDETEMDYAKMPSLLWSYFFREISIWNYVGHTYHSGGIDEPEEADELERDIVGDDISGMIHHLFNPTAEYHRYWTTADFSDEENAFLKRVYLRTWLDFPIINPMLFNRFSFQLGDSTKMSFNTGYCLAPFGDFIDENFYFRVDDVLHGPLEFSLTARQYQNKENWFPEFILTCQRFSPFSWLTLNAAGDIWWQPENLSFTTDKAQLGGSVTLGCNVYPLKKLEGAKFDFGLNFNLMYKTAGFMPEVISLDKDFALTAGISVRY